MPQTAPKRSDAESKDMKVVCTPGQSRKTRGLIKVNTLYQGIVQGCLTASFIGDDAFLGMPTTCQCPREVFGCLLDCTTHKRFIDMIDPVHEMTDISVRRDSIHCIPAKDYGFRIYRDMEICHVDKTHTSNNWYIMVFKNGLHAKGRRIMMSGLYLAPTFIPLEETDIGTQFKGYLLSVPYNVWNAFDLYNLEGLSSLCQSEPFVELGIEQIRSIELVMDILYMTIESDDRHGRMEELSNVYLALMAMLAHHYTKNERPIPSYNWSHSFTYRFIRLVDQHCLQERELAFYASYLGISTKYLSHVVSRDTGKKAKTWICEGIIKKSKTSLLTSSCSTIGKVARATGFLSSSDFCRYFRQHTGMTPLQYRKLCMPDAQWENEDNHCID